MVLSTYLFLVEHQSNQLLLVMVCCNDYANVQEDYDKNPRLLGDVRNKQNRESDWKIMPK